MKRTDENTAKSLPHDAVRQAFFGTCDKEAGGLPLKHLADISLRTARPDDAAQLLAGLLVKCSAAANLLPQSSPSR